jgi:hypothetical protein
MSHHPEEQEPAFKVVDKRRFTEEGDARADVPQEDVPAQSKPNFTPDQAKQERPAMSFSLFVQSLAHQTMMGLGLVAWPDSGLVRTELELARQSIDILLILKEKTQGNLSAEEHSLLDGMLYQLQLAYVEIAKMPPQSPGPIIK